ncbi:hypothetical protein J3R83DRAFT_2592 [Lanmaoa asiatica]|nr:hypothetical protein J3R83DRAFT_2592 [Lanmaoa asiatica]
MDTFKIGTYSDAPDSLEKGCSEAQPLHSEACHACPAQLARTRGRRFFVKHPWIVFGTVALTWLVFSYGKRAFSRQRHAWGWAGDEMGFPLPADGDVDHCVGNNNWTTYYDQPPWTLEYPYGAETTFSLPLDSDALYLISRGAFQQGLVNIEQSTEVAHTVDVRVRVAYYDDEVLERATVCQMERADREYGIGIFTPHRHHHHEPEDQLKFDVTLTLPAGNEGPLEVKKLETKMQSYSQNVADLQKSVLFDSHLSHLCQWQIECPGKEYDDRYLPSVTSEVGQFSSLNGEIDGHFTARSSLDLHILNGRITPTVNLLHRESADPSSLTIHTVNGQIDAEVSLTSEASMGGEFEVGAESSNGEIGLKFIHTPIDSVLRCHAETSVGGVEVELDSAFEGTYSLQTIVGKKLVSQHDVEDPAGKGRRRFVSQNDAAGRVDGELKWVGINGQSFVIAAPPRTQGAIVLLSHISTIEEENISDDSIANHNVTTITTNRSPKQTHAFPKLVELKNGETFNGHLVNCDNFMNITLREVYQTSADGDRFWKLKECYIRGSTIKYLRVPDTLLDAVKEEQARAREAGRSARGAGPGPGRGGRGVPPRGRGNARGPGPRGARGRGRG